MRTKISSLHFKATDSLKEFSESEVQRLVKLTDELLSCEIEYTFTKDVKEARIHLNVGGTILNAAESSDDFKKSLSLAVEKLEQQLKKRKGKQQAKRVVGE
jgi:putative sigma-54 modulation protein